MDHPESARGGERSHGAIKLRAVVPGSRPTTDGRERAVQSQRCQRREKVFIIVVVEYHARDRWGSAIFGPRSWDTASQAPLRYLFRRFAID